MSEFRWHRLLSSSFSLLRSLQLHDASGSLRVWVRQAATFLAFLTFLELILIASKLVNLYVRTVCIVILRMLRHQYATLKWISIGRIDGWPNLNFGISFYGLAQYSIGRIGIHTSEFLIKRGIFFFCIGTIGQGTSWLQRKYILFWLDNAWYVRKLVLAHASWRFCLTM